MGIEYITVNLDKKEFLDFDRLGFGTKIGAMTSEPIASVLSWLLVKPAGWLDAHSMWLGRWAGDRIEILGDEGNGREEQERVRREFKDITIESIKGFSVGNPAERITTLEPMGLIDKDGNVVVDSRLRASAREYWKQVHAQGNKEPSQRSAERDAADGGGNPSS